LQRIEEFAFYCTALKKLQIPWSVEFIGKNCFSICKSLCEITFESRSSLKEIGDFAFFETNFKRIELPKKCEIISGFSLYGVKEVSIHRENPFLIKSQSCIKSIDKKVLIRYLGEDCNIVIGREVERISRGCFHQCHSVCNVLFESGSELERIEDSAFCGTSVKMLQFPSSVEFIGRACGSGICGLFPSKSGNY
jgi:hypothetical protein